ncbi:hypothetical protein ACFLYL_02825 [Chloroflexota bacterium]
MDFAPEIKDGITEKPKITDDCILNAKVEIKSAKGTGRDACATKTCATGLLLSY